MVAWADVHRVVHEEFARLGLAASEKLRRYVNKEAYKVRVPSECYVLKDTTDEQLLAVGKNRRDLRFPTACYLHSGSQHLLFRCAEPLPFLNYDGSTEDQAYLTAMAGPDDTHLLHVFSARSEKQKKGDFPQKPQRLEAGFESSQYYKRLARYSYSVDDRAVQESFAAICE